nr:glycosyltransferase [Cryobacterium roopkundense]
MLEDADPRLQGSRYFLTVGRLNVRKNLQHTVLAALQSGELSPQTPLVIVGEADGKLGLVDRQCRDAVTSGAVIFTGFVSEARLRWLYRNASLFLFLSLGEGFGMPPLEAAYFGAPLLVSDLPVFRETLGTRARYVDPTHITTIARAIAASTVPRQRGDAFDPGELAQEHNWQTIVRAMRTIASESRTSPTKRRKSTS